MIGLVLRDGVLGFGLGLDFGLGFLSFVDLVENYFNNVGMIFLSMGFGSVIGTCLFVADLGGGEVCLEVCPGLLVGRFVISFLDCVRKYACFCNDYFSYAD